MAEIRDIWLQANHMIHSAQQIINENLRPLNLSSAEGNVLLHLLTQGEELGQEQLVEQLTISKPAVSRSLASLEDKGFVTRQPDPDDRRALRVRLTAKARAAGPAIEQVYDQVYGQALQGITQEEVQHIVALIVRVSQNFAPKHAGERE